ncbi:hypothetical protein JAAARDRAFT_121690 [Jaapia argillacea MUCL 33604]|uniref:Tetraspanin Tsp2 n=1 Tax=Jaapia argillacea MUCL 33604 TaxID=933084 RepID=A0A067QF21_9AGAM|nr:hypothetical protein JAAARDRAFT_121690 [Jaapia argillacea MUCL 33604]
MRRQSDWRDPEGDSSDDEPAPLSTIPLTPRSPSYRITRSRSSEAFRLPSPESFDRPYTVDSDHDVIRLVSYRGSPLSDRPYDLDDHFETLRYLPSSNYQNLNITRGFDSGSSSTESYNSYPEAKSQSDDPYSDTRPLLPRNIPRKWPKPKYVKGLAKEGRGLGLGGKWTIHKWCLIVSVTTVLLYGIAGMAIAVLTWFRAWDHADVMYVADYDVLLLLTLTSSLLLLTSLLGLTSTLLNSRPFLAYYTLLLFPCFISLLSIGYTSYKRSTFSLDRKLNLAWSQWYTPLGRLLIQDSLRCCGYYNPIHEATSSTRCYSRSPLPGCKGKLFRFEKDNLTTIWSAVFSLVPLHIINIFVALVCANHVTKRFGKGIMPKKYWLKVEDVVLMRREKGLGETWIGVVRPGMTRAGLSSGMFREDKEERRPLLGE